MSIAQPTPHNPFPDPSTEFGGPERIHWDDAMTWARRNNVEVSDKPDAAMEAINDARSRFGLPSYWITDLPAKFRVVRKKS